MLVAPCYKIAEEIHISLFCEATLDCEINARAPAIASSHYRRTIKLT